MLAYRVREHNNQARQKKKTTGVLKNVMQDQKGCKKNKIRAEEQITTAVATGKTARRGRTYRHKAGDEGTSGNTGEKKQKKRRTAGHYCRFRAPSIELNEKYQSNQKH